METLVTALASAVLSGAFFVLLVAVPIMAIKFFRKK